MNSTFIKKGVDSWSVFTVSLALIFSIPIFAVIGLAFTPSDEVWSHLSTTVLPRYARNTFLLMLGVGAGVLVIGISTAWLVTMYRFPGQRVFEWALFLPLAMPAYVIATVYVQILEFAGPVQSFLRLLFGWQSAQDYWFPHIVSLEGAIAMLVLVLYPYVYLLARASFLDLSMNMMEVGQLLGKGAWKNFWQVALPLSRPAIVVGLILALMETIGDFGTVQIFAVSTFTTGIYSVWLGMYNAPGAAQLATTLLVFVAILVFLERLSRRRKRYHHNKQNGMDKKKPRLSGGHALMAFLCCFLPILFGFLIPFLLLLKWVFETYEQTLTHRFINDASNSVMLAGIAAVLSVLLALLTAYGVRLRPTKLVRITTRIATLGYAVPGPIIALGVLLPFAGLDNAVDRFMRDVFDFSTGLILSGTIVAVVFAYLVRFLALSFGTLEAGLTKITKNLEEVSKTLGQGTFATLRRVHFPLLQGSALTAAILVFVDVMKELPLTLMLQPFNFSTLATRIYEYASDERLHESSLWSVTIVMVGILPVIILSRGITKSHAEQSSSETSNALLWIEKWKAVED